MNNDNNQNHPDIETLANYIGGLLEEHDAEVTRKHLETCPACRLELKQMKRFAEIESDTELLEEAAWKSAQSKLEQAFRENVLPEVLPPKLDDARSFWAWWRVRWQAIWQTRWLAPVAAAAAVLLMVIMIERAIPPEMPSGDLGPMRGQPTEGFDIAIKEPAGNIAEPPEHFTWDSERDNDYYTIEIFLSDLTKMFEQDGIEGTRWVTSDSLKSLLQLDTIYLWSVTGHKGLERETVSPNAWFKIEGKD